LEQVVLAALLLTVVLQVLTQYSLQSHHLVAVLELLAVLVATEVLAAVQEAVQLALELLDKAATVETLSTFLVLA
jgi:hypothetical protein